LLAELATRTHVASFLHEAVSRQMARHAIHAAAIDQFDCQQKVATFLIELAFRTGVASAGRGGVRDAALADRRRRLSRTEYRHVVATSLGSDHPAC